MTDQKVVLITGATGGVGQALTFCSLEQNHCLVLISDNKDYLTLMEKEIKRAVPEKAKDILFFPVDFSKKQDFDDIASIVQKKFGRLDAIVNNASILDVTATKQINAKHVKQVMDVGAIAPYFLSRSFVPLLKKASEYAHIVNISPPISPQNEDFFYHFSYSLSSYNLSMCTMGLSWELFYDNIAVNSIWPRTLLDSTFIQRLHNYQKIRRHVRKPRILAEAVLSLLNKASKACSGNFLIDDLVLEGEGVTDFSVYLNEPDPDFLFSSPLLHEEIDKGIYQTIPLESINIRNLISY